MTKGEDKLFLKKYKALVSWLDCRRGKTIKLNDDVINTVIEALREIEQYRAIGTVEEIKKVVQFLSLDNDNGIIEDLQLLNKYRFIGTVEECREARERQMPKVPNIWGDGYDNEGNLIYDMYDCPNCAKSYEVDYHDHKYCPECGQAIDWSE